MKGKFTIAAIVLTILILAVFTLPPLFRWAVDVYIKAMPEIFRISGRDPFLPFP
jgi:hypothetical protein